MTKAKDARLKELSIEVNLFKQKLIRFENFVNDPENIHNVDEIDLRKEKVQLEFQNFESVQLEIVRLQDESSDADGISEEFEKIYFSALATAKKLTKNTIDTKSRENINNLVFTPSQVQLPVMNLPKFSGSYECWPSFADEFKSAIHNNSFTNTQKLIYLRSCLTGKAYDKIQSLETTDANYGVAWSILEKYYHDPLAVIDNRIKAIIDMPNCTKPSAQAIGNLVDSASKHYRALEALKVSYVEYFPVFTILSKLDEQTRRKWKERVQGSRCSNTTRLPTMELLEFLCNRQKVLEDSNAIKHDNQEKQMVKNIRRMDNNTSHSYLSQTNFVCSICGENHFTYKCESLSKANINERYYIVKNAKLCYNCLRKNHVVSKCRAQKCKICGQNHHTILHRSEQKQTEKPRSENAIQSNMACFKSSTATEVFLSTAVIKIKDSQNLYHDMRVLLDSGSQSNFITKRFADILKVQYDEINIPVTGINQDISYYIILADPNFNNPSQIDGIIGSELFYKLFCIGQKPLGNLGAIIQKTLFGWVIAGKITEEHSAVRQCNISTSLQLQRQIERFWEIEEPTATKHLSQNESDSEDHFNNNTYFDSANSRYVVRLPFKDNKAKLGQSYQLALKRFYALERSLARNPERKAQYVEFLKEYEKLGHMTRVPLKTFEGCFLPHHGVVKGSSITTKLRVVFDASAKTTSNLSLNDILLTGPIIQEDLMAHLLRFRLYNYVLMADIEKMYRMIEVHPDDRIYQKILWREDIGRPVEAYELNTVTFGTTCATFLATRTLSKLANDISATHPEIIRVLKEHFYVDNLVTGAQTYTEAKTICDSLWLEMKKAGFNLRQWVSNDESLINHLDNQTRNLLIRLDTNETIKTLGILWNANNDFIEYAVSFEKCDNKVTKRTILSQIAKIFDPIGLLGPVIVKGKMLMQELWQLQTNWDESVPISIDTAWREYRNDLQSLTKFKCERRISLKQDSNLELHGFCDASEKAYGACIYIRSNDNYGNVRSSLLCAKSRVAPLKTRSLPRLELCAATLLIQLYRTTRAALRDFEFSKKYMWSDSTITLHWIKAVPRTLKTFVANRVSEIQEASSGLEWRHVKSQDNPADLLSRGTTAKKLINNSL